MIYLKNKGEIDIDVIKTMGVNVKTGDSPIGHFGTGLKYAIAVFLREGINIELYIGENRFEFYTEEITIRGEKFDKCCMKGFDSLELGFVTEMGKNWEPWQAYREVHSNTLDECGEVSTDRLGPEEGHTLFVIDVPDDYLKTFLPYHNKQLVYKSDDMDIYEGESNHLYHRGIRVADLCRPTMYTYDITHMIPLTEDRTIQSEGVFHMLLTKTVAECDDEDVVAGIVSCSPRYYESHIDASWYVTLGETFKTAVAEGHKHVSDNFKACIKFNEPKTASKKTGQELAESIVADFENLALFWGFECSYDGERIVITGDDIDSSTWDDDDE